MMAGKRLSRRADRSCFQNKITAEVFRFVREYFLSSSSVGMTCGRFAVGARRFVRNDRRYGICARKNAAIYGI